MTPRPGPPIDPLADLRAPEAPPGLEAAQAPVEPAHAPITLTPEEMNLAQIAVVRAIRADGVLTQILHRLGMDPAGLIARVTVAALFVAVPEEDTPDA